MILSEYSKPIAGVFVGAGALLLIYMGHTEPAIALLAGMLGFFIGEANGVKKKIESLLAEQMEEGKWQK